MVDNYCLNAINDSDLVDGKRHLNVKHHLLHKKDVWLKFLNGYYFVDKFLNVLIQVKDINFKNMRSNSISLNKRPNLETFSFNQFQLFTKKVKKKFRGPASANRLRQSILSVRRLE